MATYTEIHLRRDSTLNWYASNPRLALGEPGVDLTLHRFKIGNGIDRWNELPYMDDDLYKLLDKQQQETADKVQDILNKIAANKLDADTKHNTLTTEVRNTSRELNARMTAVEDEQAEYEEDLTARQDSYEAGLTGEFNATKQEVHAGLEEFSETRDQLTTRMDVIAGQSTEDTEILDARVDADYTTHPNLGHNIRSIHQEVRDAKEEYTEGLRTATAQIAGLKANDEVFGAELTRQVDTDEKLGLHGEFLQEQITEAAEGLLQVGAALSEEIQHSKGQDEEISTLRADLEAEHAAREREDTQIREDISVEASARRLEDEHTREELSARVQELREVDEEQRRDLEHEAESRQIRDEDLAGQVEDLSEAVLAGQVYAEKVADRLTTEIRTESRERKAAVENTDRVSALRDEHLQEQIDDNIDAEIATLLAVKTEAEQRKESISRLDKKGTDIQGYLDEAVTDLAEGVIMNAVAIANALKDQKSPVNWSSAKSLAIPEPRCAVVNFTGLTAMPTSKTVDIPAVMEFWDMQGNYFRKNIVCSAQGAASMGYPKKNVKFDLLNDDGSEFSLRIGNWVAQDSFHLKAYYTDFFRGAGAVCYKFWDEVMRFNGLDKDRPYKKALQIEGVRDLTLQLDTGALCHPDSFPCIVYLNGEFYGVFAWQLKKNRKNYHMEKSNVEHIHLDGALYAAYFWNGVIDWTQFEIRNPNKLYTMDGEK